MVVAFGGYTENGAAVNSDVFVAVVGNRNVGCHDRHVPCL